MSSKVIFSVLFVLILSLTIQSAYSESIPDAISKKLIQKSLDKLNQKTNKTQSVKPLNQTKQVEPVPDDSTIKKLEIKNKRMELKELLKSFKKQDIDRTEFLQRYAVLRAQINSLSQ